MRNLNMGASDTNRAGACQVHVLHFLARCAEAVLEGCFSAVQVPHVPSKEAVAAKLRELLRSVPNDNQSEMARRCGIARAELYRYLAEEHMPGAESLAAIASAFGVSVDWILGMPAAVNDSKGPSPDGKISIPASAAAAVDDEAVRRFLAGEPLGDRDIAYLRFDEHVRLVDSVEFASLRAKLDDAQKKSRRTRRSRPPE